MKSVFVKVFLDNNVVPFIVNGDESLDFGDYVVIQTKYGKDLGKVMSKPSDVMNVENSIISKATEEEINNFKKNRIKDLKEENNIKSILSKHNPEAHFVSCYFLLNNARLIVNFFSDKRIDFREAVKDLASVYKTRIEMRQISNREAFKLKGGIGICGMETCCSRFNHLKQHITASMVREQGLTESNAKTIGPCGKLVCCLAYEAHCYICGKNIIFDNSSQEVIYG
ncbi:MAG: hypothetical protein N2712_03200 [Brevinematales bacterium]|nr:hypothetical protein [Brevinematales bacterium]